MPGQEAMKTISEYYSVSCRPFDTQGDGALLSAVRREHFLGGKTVGGSVHAVESGREVHARYRVGRGCFRWRKASGHLVLQESFPLPDGNYRVVSHDPAGKLISSATFDRSLRWLQTAYFNGDPSRPSAVLFRREQSLSLLEYDPLSERYDRQELFPCRFEPGTAAQSYIDGKAGEPRVLAQTDAGFLCFCTREECARRLSLYRELEQSGDSLTPDWPGSAESGSLDFQVIANDASSLRAAAFRQAAQAAQAARAAAAAKKSAAASLPGPSVPAPAPDAGDYAADHEIFLSVSPEPQEQRVAKASAPVSGKYAVAAKGLSGGIVHAAALEKSAASPMEPEPASLIPAKRIVVSSMESYQYFGKLLDGLREGRGRTQMQSGHTAYEGEYHADMRDGFGVYYYKSGKICYAGGWKRNLRDGMGVAFGSRDGSIFVGHWENGVATGGGSAFNMEGSLIYTGGWKNGRRHGHGTEYSGGKIVRVGEWEDDRFCSGYSLVGGTPEESSL